MIHTDLMIVLLPVVISLVVTLTYGSRAMRKTNEFRKTWLTATVINFVLIGAASLVGLFFTEDYMYRMFGLIIYGISAVFVGVIYTIAFASMRQNYKAR